MSTDNSTDRWINFQAKLQELERERRELENFYKVNPCSIPYAKKQVADIEIKTGFVSSKSDKP